jgi:hypothetical protein
MKKLLIILSLVLTIVLIIGVKILTYEPEPLNIKIMSGKDIEHFRNGLGKVHREYVYGKDTIDTTNNK